MPVPLRVADGRYRMTLRFRLDASAPDDAVDRLDNLLRIAPRGTSIRLGIPSAGTRLLEITGAHEGDVYVFAIRCADEIRAMGDLVDEGDAPTRKRQPTPSLVEANWNYEAPGEEEAQAAPERRGFLQRWLRVGRG
jgi:hypothetical protein